MSSNTTQAPSLESENTAWHEIWHFFRVWDERFEAFQTKPAWYVLARDMMAGLIVSFVSIPLAIGFSLASGLSPEQGVIASAFAMFIGGAYGGSKYQVYGPTAAFITTIAWIVKDYGPDFLILATMIAGVIIALMGVFRLGKWFQYVPNSVVVGFTLGIALTIVLGQMPDLMGGNIKHGTEFLDRMAMLPDLIQDAHGHALLMGLVTFLIIKNLYKISIYIPSPLIAVLLCTFLANFVWQETAIPLISSKFGALDPNVFKLTPPQLAGHHVLDLVQPVVMIVFIAALESLLSAKMADRIAHEIRPFNPNKELFAQGVVNFLVPLVNGFACTGALARTATNIKVGALTPFAAIIQGGVMIVLIVFFTPYLSMVPMASIAGLMVFVAINMVKPAELRGIWHEGLASTTVMLSTALITLFSDLFLAVAMGTVLFYLIKLVFPQSFKDNTLEHSQTGHSG
jgi:SulP family sulfate permease